MVVADAGMLSTGNLKALDEAGLFFIVGARQSRAPHDLEQYWDQYGDQAEQRLGNKIKDKGEIDAEAASIILQDYLEEHI